MNEYDLIPLRGNHFRTPKDKTVYELIGVGQKLTLAREPENEHDSQAIKVLLVDGEDTFHLGYVAREFATWIAPELDMGWPSTCVVSDIDFERNRKLVTLTITTGP